MKFKQIFRNNILLIFIILQPLLDIISYFQMHYFNVSYTWIARIILLFVIFLYSYLQSNNKKKYILCCLPFAIYYILHIINLNRIGYFNFVLDTKYFIQVFQFPILTISLISIVKNDFNQTKTIKKALVINFLIIFISVVLSYLTNSYEFTYYSFGLTGWFSSANTQSMILSALSCLCMGIVYKKGNWIYNFIISLIIFLLLFLNATKACYLTLLFLLILMIFISILDLKKSKLRIINLLIYLMFFIISLCFYGKSYTFLRKNELDNNISSNQEYIDKIENNNNNNDNNNINNNNNNNNNDNNNSNNNEEENITGRNDCNTNLYDNYEQQQIELLKSSYIYREIIEIHGIDAVYEEMKDNINGESLSDNRLRKKINAKIYFKQNDLLTKSFGIGYSIIQKDEMSLENDITALFYYYGYVGIILYFGFIMFFIKKSLEEFIFSSKKFNDSEYLILNFTIFLLLFGSEYSGAFLRKSNANVYFSVIFTLLYFNLFYKNLKSKNITFLNLHLGYGGIETATINSANALVNDYNVEIISFYKLSSEQTHKLDKKVRVKYLYYGEPNKDKVIDAFNKREYFKFLKEGIISAKILFDKKYLIIKEILNSDSFAIISTRYEFSKLLSRYGAKKVIKIAQEHHHHNNNQKYINILKNKYKNIDYLCALTEKLKKDYEEFLVNNNHTKVILLPNILPDNSVKISNLKSKNIISVSRLDEGKRINELIDIFSKLKIKTNKLYIIGDGDEMNSLKKKVNKLNLSDRVIFTGYLDSKDQEDYYLDSCVFAMTSVSEGLPMVLLEAMQHGLPCIAYNTDSGVSDIIKNNKNGYIIDIRNEKEYIDKLNYILLNEKVSYSFRENAIETVKRFDSKHMLKIWNEMLSHNEVNYERKIK